jgi:hypothetical protein
MSNSFADDSNGQSDTPEGSSEESKGKGEF